MKRPPPAALPAAKAAVRALLILTALMDEDPRARRLVEGAKRWWSGKKIAVIGPTASGKDSFLARLQGKPIPTAHSPSAKEAVKTFRVKFTLATHETIDFRCKGVTNIGGETEDRDAPSGWLSVCRDADIVFYMMTITDLLEKEFRKGHRIRGDLDWLLTAIPHLKSGALIHVLINKVDERVDDHTEYPALAQELARELRVFHRTVEKALHPYEARYTGATLISTTSRPIYTVAMNEVLRSVYAAFGTATDAKLLPVEAGG